MTPETCHKVSGAAQMNIGDGEKGLDSRLYWRTLQLPNLNSGHIDNSSRSLKIPQFLCLSRSVSQGRQSGDILFKTQIKAVFLIIPTSAL